VGRQKRCFFRHPKGKPGVNPRDYPSEHGHLSRYRILENTVVQQA
jgi:hypothetical protein